MKKIIIVFLFLFNLQSWTKADNISDFQIEGISVNDSALNFLTETFIKSEINTNGWYKDNKYFEITYPLENSIYEDISLTFKPNDKKYIIYQVAGTIKYKNIDKCKKQKNDIVREISEMYSFAKKFDAGKNNYSADPSGESKVYSVYFEFETGGWIDISCYDVTEKLAKKNNWMHKFLAVIVVNKEFGDFLSN